MLHEVKHLELPSYIPEDWNDWKWQYKNRVTNLKELKRHIPICNDEAKSLKRCLNQFRMAITPYYASLIDINNPECPIRKQCIPSLYELIIDRHESLDPLAEEHYSPVPGIVHRYPDRVLFLLTGRCAMYCRHCTRRRLAGNEDYTVNEAQITACIEYIQNNSNIRDVLLSGGDPLVLSDKFLESILKRLRRIPHVEIIRIGTRTPVVMPIRITDELVNMLKKYQPLWINTHFNHPNEITEDSAKACEKIVDAGIPLGNQTVLLKGINDNAEVMKELCLKLVRHRVRPYYLYQCDVANGIDHFRTTVETGIEIMAKLRGYISGFAVPTYVIDAPNGGGKIPILKNYMTGIDEEGVHLVNYLGDQYLYPQE